jgi:hypothetical protein
MSRLLRDVLALRKEEKKEQEGTVRFVGVGRRRLISKHDVDPTGSRLCRPRLQTPKPNSPWEKEKMEIWQYHVT